MKVNDEMLVLALVAGTTIDPVNFTVTLISLFSW